MFSLQIPLDTHHPQKPLCKPRKQPGSALSPPGVFLCHLCLGQEAAIEHSTENTDYSGKLAYKFCTCMDGNNSPYHQVAVFIIQLLNPQTEAQD